jgi:hypothetical protein
MSTGGIPGMNAPSSTDDASDVVGHINWRLTLTSFRWKLEIEAGFQCSAEAAS